VYIIFIGVALLVAVGLGGCRGQKEPVTKTEYVEKIKIDTLMREQRDSVYIREKGDSVYVYRYKYIDRYRVKIQRDTVAKTDTVIVLQTSKPQKQPVKKETFGAFRWVRLLLFIALVLWIVYKFYLPDKLKKIFKSLKNKLLCQKKDL